MCFAESLGLCLYGFKPSISSLSTGHLGQVTVALYSSRTADLPLVNASISMWPRAGGGGGREERTVLSSLLPAC